MNIVYFYIDFIILYQKTIYINSSNEKKPIPRNIKKSTQINRNMLSLHNRNLIASLRKISQKLF